MTQSLPSAFKNASAGIAHACITGRNFKIELCFAAAAVVLGIALGISAVEWAIVLVCMGLVLGGECANTAIEAVVDLVSPEQNELARIAKDCAAGAVLVSSVASLFVAVCVYLPKMLSLIGLS